MSGQNYPPPAQYPPPHQNTGSSPYPPPGAQGWPQQQPAYQPPQQGQQWGGYQQPPPQQGWSGYPQYGATAGGAESQQPLYPPAYAPMGGYGGQGEYTDAEDPWKGDVTEFEDKSVRMAFIRKVYAIIFIQLMITFGTVCLFLYNRDLNYFVRTHSWTMWVAFGLTFVLLMVISCVGDIRRKSPHNYILLLLFTCCEAYLVAVCTSFYRADTVMLAVAITAACTLALTLFAFQTKIDFTMAGGVLLCALMCLMMFSLLAMFFKNKIMDIVIASLGALIFMVYIIYDTQTMIGGEHSNGISSEEYVFAALSLYMDVVNLFLNILRLVAAASDNSGR